MTAGALPSAFAGGAYDAVVEKIVDEVLPSLRLPPSCAS